MPLMQDDIKAHYETAWKRSDESTDGDAGLVYSSPVEDAVLYPLYAELLADLNVKVSGGSVLDVGAGSGRWVRYFLERFTPAALVGIDFTQASVDLLSRRYHDRGETRVSFRQADLTDPSLDLGQQFDLLNVMNVLFHIPEPDRFARALVNLRRHLAPGGRIVTTEYLPRQTMRTNWMLVRSRYDFETAIAAAGLRTVAVRASCVYSNDPMGIDGPDSGTRGAFNAVRTGMNEILSLPMNEQAKRFFVKFLSDVERSFLQFGRERVGDVDMPSQKLVALAAV